MAKLCICQICTCGRHKCPHNPNGLPFGDPTDPCRSTEYRNRYTQHPAANTKSCKPEAAAMMSEDPIGDKTTHRVDFVRHQVEKPYVHPKDIYRAPEGPMDTLTNYTKEYNRKPLNPPKPIVRKTRRVPGAFEGVPTYRTDFRKWPVKPPEPHKPDVYCPPADPFDGNSSYQLAYVFHKEPPRKSMKPPDAALQSVDPLAERTDYRDNYTKHQLPPRAVREVPEWMPNPNPLDDLSNYRKDFTRKDQGKQPSCKPDTRPFQSADPLSTDTTQRTDYKKWPDVRPPPRDPDPYRAPEGVMATDTTNRTDFNLKPLQKVASCRPKERKKLPGRFDANTSYREDFRGWPAERVRATMKDVYVPIDEPFEGLATYRRDYVDHRVPPRPSMKPLERAMVSEAPLQDATEYRNEFTKKYVSPCVAGVIQAGGASTGYVFREQDAVGHKWYEPAGMTVVG